MRTITINPTNAPEQNVPTQREVLEAQLVAIEQRHNDVYRMAIAASRAKDYDRSNELHAACGLARREYSRIEREVKWLRNKARKNGLA